MVKTKTLLNQICYLVAAISIAPVLGFLDFAFVLLAMGATVLGAWFDYKELHPIPGWGTSLVALAVIVNYSLQFSQEDIATPLVHVLISLLGIRMVSTKKGRDYLQIFVLGVFILAGSSLLSLNVEYIIYLVLMVFSITVGLVLLCVFETDSGLAFSSSQLLKLLRVAIVLPTGSLVLMALLFFILPRTSHPLWNFLNPTNKATSGLTEAVKPGAFAKISTGNQLAFRAESPELAPEDLYWRALVLNRPEREEWIRVTPPPEISHVVDKSPSLQLQIFPTSRNDKYLITLDRTTALHGVQHKKSSDHVYETRRKQSQRHSYQIDSKLGAPLTVIGQVDHEFYKALPEFTSVRVQSIAQNISVLPDTDTKLEALADFFRKQSLRYAETDLPSGPNVIEEFLFEKRQGYCEFFASAYVTLARLAGIPARLVGGYYGGEYNPLGSYYLVTEDKAHVWAEVLDNENRWHRVDPSLWATNAASTLGASRLNRLSMLQKITDSLNYYWIQAIVVFDFSRQITMFQESVKTIGSLSKPSVPTGYFWWSLGGVGTCLLIVISRHQRRLSREAKLLRKFQKRVARRYGSTILNETTGLSELAENVDSPHCREFARIYQQAVFTDRALRSTEWKILNSLLKKV
ncbi:MAG: DUF3488 domain-containing transglutaminase family protein [Deltaproteobacteria bacterium]|jgi:hypothetical protein|nr:DUF3488 domain-containing transglutaminase family protein [Deltaproteobacteria bacterium]